MDFGRNLQVPDISTSEVYFKRNYHLCFQSSCFITGVSVFYTYDQREGKKGADDVVSMLNHFICNYFDPCFEELKIFCDECSGQNNNFTVLRYFHYMNVKKKRFKELSITYDISGAAAAIAKRWYPSDG